MYLGIIEVLSVSIYTNLISNMCVLCFLPLLGVLLKRPTPDQWPNLPSQLATFLSLGECKQLSVWTKKNKGSVWIYVKRFGCVLASDLSIILHPRTFAPVWDVFKCSTEKLVSCHMELVRKLQELIKEVQKYVEEQAKAHKKVQEGRTRGTRALRLIQVLIAKHFWKFWASVACSVFLWSFPPPPTHTHLTPPLLRPAETHHQLISHAWGHRTQSKRGVRN